MRDTLRGRGQQSTGGPRYPRSFYFRIRLFAFETLVLKATFKIKMCLFICKFSIHGLKYVARRIYRE